AGAFRVPEEDRRNTMTSANTVASSPITMNASAIPPLTVTPFRSSGPGHRALHVRYQGVMPWREGCCTLARASIHADLMMGRWHRPLAAAGALYDVLSMIIRAARSNTSLPRG